MSRAHAPDCRAIALGGPARSPDSPAARATTGGTAWSA